MDRGVGTGGSGSPLAEDNEGASGSGTASGTTGCGSDCGPTFASLSLLLGSGDGGFAAPITYSLGRPGQNGTYPAPVVVAADFNQDGNLDLAVGHYLVQVLLGEGDGGFTEKDYDSNGAVAFLAVGDFNGDGKLDSVVAGANLDTINVLLGDGHGNFSAPVSSRAPNGATQVAVGDLDGDGNADIVLTSEETDLVSVLFGNGDGTFGPAVSLLSILAPSWGEIADLNGDGRLDLVVTDASSNAIDVFLGQACQP